MTKRNSPKRLNRLIKEKRKDTYLSKTAKREPAVCKQCGASLMNGRWTWEKASLNAYETICPACKRITDKYPAGFIEIKGSFYSLHENEIANLIKNTERIENKQHPLERIMSLKLDKYKAILTTTGIHLARRIGEALFRSYQGEFNFQYAEGDRSIRVSWER
jgi:NMD protein affecting ribosome stability and mRNA decay